MYWISSIIHRPSSWSLVQTGWWKVVEASIFMTVTLSLNYLFQITEHGLMSLAKQCKQLRKLNVSRCYGVTDRGVAALVQGCPLLTELDIGWCYKVSDQSLRLIPLHCSHFESIRIKGCCVSDRTLRALYTAKISVNNFFWVSSAKTFEFTSFFIFHPHSFIFIHWVYIIHSIHVSMVLSFYICLLDCVPLIAAKAPPGSF